MRKKVRSGPKLLPAVVNLEEVFYITKVTDTNLKEMSRLLAFYDNGKGGKTRFMRTAPISLTLDSAKLDFQMYILSAEKNSDNYKPMKFLTEEEAIKYIGTQGNKKFYSIKFD